VKKQRFEFGHGASLVAGNGINGPIPDFQSPQALFTSVLRASRPVPPGTCAGAAADQIPMFSFIFHEFCAPAHALDIAREIKYQYAFNP